MPWKTEWSVSVDGKDASAAMNDYLISIELDEKEGGSGDTADLVLDDTDGRNILPRAGARVIIVLGGQQKFDGWTEEPEWSYARGAGRTINVHCVSHDSRGKVKDPQRWHQDGGTLADFLTRAAKEAGLAGISVAKSLAAIERPWWSADGASFLHLGQRMAKELGAIFQVRGDRAIFAERGSGASASGAALATVTFDCAAEQVIRVSGTPFTGRENRTEVKGRWFDRQAGKWRVETVEVEPIPGGPSSKAELHFPRADSDGAKKGASGRKNAAAHDKGSLSVESDLRLDVPIGSPVTIVNARPGVDGSWKAKSARHKLDRHGGGHSTFELARPSGSAGTDARKKASSSSSSSSTASGVQEVGTVPASPVA